eukprot:465057-Pelagomonas_calceolata.AAC.2
MPSDVRPHQASPLHVLSDLALRLSVSSVMRNTQIGQWSIYCPSLPHTPCPTHKRTVAPCPLVAPIFTYAPAASPSCSLPAGNAPSPSRVPARRSRGSIFGRPLASRAPAAPSRGLGATGVTPAGISWGAIGGVGLALGSSGAQGNEELEQEQQRRSSVRDLSVVARLMEALHKPPTEVTGEAGKDLIVTLDSGNSSSSSAGNWGSAGAGDGWKDGGRGEGGKGDLISEIGDAWCEYEQELMGKGVEGSGKCAAKHGMWLVVIFDCLLVAPVRTDAFPVKWSRARCILNGKERSLGRTRPPWSS